MKTLLVAHSLRRGGAERVMLEIANHLADENHDVEVCGLVDENEYSEIIDDRIAVSSLISRSDYRGLKSMPSIGRELGRVISRFNPEVIQIHSPTTLMASFWASISEPLIHVIHGHQRLAFTGMRRIAQRQFDRWVYRKTKAKPVAVSPSVAESVSAHFGIPIEKIKVICNGINTNRFVTSGELPVTPPRIVCVGTLGYGKQTQLAVEALAKLKRSRPAVHLDLVGDGPMREELVKLVADLDLVDSVTFHGILSDVVPILQRASVFWTMSKSEGLPLAVLEAMACGLPTVGFHVPGVRDVIVNDKTGYLITPFDVDKFADSTEKILTESMREKMGAESRKLVEQSHDEKLMTKNHIEYMMQLKR